MNVGQAAHLSGQAAQMNQVSGSGVGGADGLLPQQHQQMQDAVGVSGIDFQFVMLRNSMREKIFEYICRKQLSADWRRRLPELAKRLEEILFRKFSNKNDYYNMTRGPVEPQLQFAIKTLSVQNQQNQQNQQMSRQMASSSGYGTMIPTPCMTRGTSGNTRIPYVADNNALSSSGAGMVPQNANMGASMPGLMSNGYQHLTTSIPQNSTANSTQCTMGSVGVQRMIPTPGFSNQQSTPANPDYSNRAGYFNGESAVAPHMQHQKQFPSNPNSHQIQHIGSNSNSGIHSSMLENSSQYGLSDGHMNGGMGLHGPSTQLTNRTMTQETYMNTTTYGSSPKPLQQQINQHPSQRIPTIKTLSVQNQQNQQKGAVSHPHRLTNHPSAADRDAQNTEDQQIRVQQLIRKMLDLLVHASTCRSGSCQYPICRKVKELFRHGMQCKTRASGGCVLCKKIWFMLELHARACKDSDCNVPRCRDVKELLRQLQQQS